MDEDQLFEERLMASVREFKELIRTNPFIVPPPIGPGPPPPPPIGLVQLVLGSDRRDPVDNNGCVEVYTDEKQGTEVYVVNDVLVERKICSTDDEEATFERNNPMVPVSIRGLEKIQLSRRPTPPRSRTNLPGSKAYYLIETRRVAEDALAYFNKKHNTDYKLVEPRDSFTFYDSYVKWMHANFTAKPGAALDRGNGDSSIKLFFAEGKFVRPEHSTKYHYEFTECCILDDVTTTGKCWKCPDSPLISHPTRGFHKGCYCDQPCV